MKQKGKAVLSLLLLCVLPAACAQPPAAETLFPTPRPTPVESVAPIPASLTPLTLAGQELDYAVLRHSYDDDPRGFDFDEAACLEERFQACGFMAEEPFYESYDPEGRMELTLWYDEKTGSGIGLYSKYFTDGPVLYGFGFEETLAAENWEQVEYIRWEPEHDVYESRYDDLGRLVYEEGYITHGSLRYYYIYEEESKSPKYVLFLDDGTGITPEFVCFLYE